MTLVIISAPDSAPIIPVTYWDESQAELTPYYAERMTDLDGSIRVRVYGWAHDDDPEYPKGYGSSTDYKDADDAPEWARELFGDAR